MPTLVFLQVDETCSIEPEILSKKILSIYKRKEGFILDSLLQIIPPAVTDEMNRALLREVNHDEIKKAVFDLGRMKSPGPDSFPGIFFQNHWHVVKKDIIRLVKKNFYDGEFS